jgi:hypothetical protein
MNQVIRILAVVIRLRDSNVRYKIAYRRSIYNGYDAQNGDDLDQAIFDFFRQKNPTQILWEFVGPYIENQDLSHLLKTFTPKNIPLIIMPNLSSLNELELDRLQQNDTTFHPIDRSVTLFYRSNMDATHENWVFLPQEIRISIDYKVYAQLAQTIFPY